ncbi:hypothetical protein PMAYCL1PPCAC_00681, partial [Pristionchus mayeri]
MDACEKAKKALARMPSARIDYTTKTGQQVGFDITHTTFVDICEDLFDKTMRLVDKAISEARLTKKNLDEIVLVGGSTRMQHVRTLLSDHFPDKKIYTDKTIDPDTAIAQGAALMAASLSGAISSKFTEKQLEERGVKPIKLVDVTPHSLGVRMDGDLTSIVIPKNTMLPHSTNGIYTNAADFKTHIEIEIVEGENIKASRNVALAKFNINVKPKRKNENSIQLSFSIDKSGILEVTAIDTDTNKKASITVQS